MHVLKQSIANACTKVTITPDAIKQFLALRVISYLKAKKADCDHMAYLSLCITKTFYNSPIRKEVYYIVKGGHAFTVFGRDLKSKNDDIASWGKDCVVCDAWAGVVAPASVVTLRAHCPIGLSTPPGKMKGYSVLPYFNRFFHSLSPDWMGEAPNNMNTVVTLDAQKRVVAFEYEYEKKLGALQSR